MELKQTKIVAIDGYWGVGKTTAANIIAGHFGGIVISGEQFQCQFMDNNPNILQEVFGCPVNGMAARDYIIKHLHNADQLIGLITQTKEYVERSIRLLINEHIANNVPVVIFEYGSASSMYPWTDGQETKKILITTDIEKHCQMLRARDGDVSADLQQALRQGLAEFINPESADFIVYNDYKSLAEYRDTLLSLCDWIQDDKNSTKPSRNAFAGLVK